MSKRKEEEPSPYAPRGAARKNEKITQAMLFYTHAYASWEKGSIENFNRIIRRFYPKPTDFSRLTPKAIEILQYKRINYPSPTQLKTKAIAGRF